MADTKLPCPHCEKPGPHKLTHAGSNPRFTCSRCGKSFRESTALGAVEPTPVEGTRFVVTSAVSGSLVHPAFLRSLEAYCVATKSQLLVVPIRYHNPTSTRQHSGEVFDERLEKYIAGSCEIVETENGKTIKKWYGGRYELCPNLTLMADVPTQPTAARPLSGLQTMSGRASAIFGHPKVALETVASLGTHKKIVLTTGAVTRPEYSSSKAGKKGEFHHVMGAVIVEIEGSHFHLRHVHANADGSFYDLDAKWSETGKTTATAKVLTCGDLHAVRANPSVLQATFFGKGSMLARLKPAKVVLHDVLDFQSASHHNRFFDKVRLAKVKKNDVMAEVTETCALLDKIVVAAGGAEVLIVPSNHHDHFTKWLENKDNAHDDVNAEVFHETKTAFIKALKAGKAFDPLTFWASKLMDNFSKVRFLDRNESFIVDKVEYSQHGDLGPNGVKGSIGAFTKAGSKMVIGHSHTPGIMDGVVQVGTSSEMKMGYNNGLSSWLHSHCVAYPNGKRALLTIIDSRWCE